MFHFKGALPASKSWLNRALILQHYQPDLKIVGETNAEDVEVMKVALSNVHSKQTFNLGQGGTSLRFFCFLISRIPGDWVLKGQPRLMERPQGELLNLLKQLGVSAVQKQNEILIKSNGWQPTPELSCDGAVSSQFISGLLLNSPGISFDLNLKIKKPIVSYDYLKMTLRMLDQVGIEYSTSESSPEHSVRILKNQKVKAKDLNAELDLSSAFSLVSAAIIDGDVAITNWIADSIQPDHAFVEILKKMNIFFEINVNHFHIKKQMQWNGCDVNLDSSPDLFPVLAILCALANGPSFLRGASQLKFKESDRLKKTVELLTLAGFQTEQLSDALLIHGKSSTRSKNLGFQFNPDHDHRMAMAAGLLKLAGYKISIETPEVVQKSYPQFWQDTGLSL